MLIQQKIYNFTKDRLKKILINSPPYKICVMCTPVEFNRELKMLADIPLEMQIKDL